MSIEKASKNLMFPRKYNETKSEYQVLCKTCEKNMTQTYEILKENAQHRSLTKMLK